MRASCQAEPAGAKAASRRRAVAVKGLLVLPALRHRQLIAAVVIWILRMALDPVVTEGVAFLQLQKPLPSSSG